MSRLEEIREQLIDKAEELEVEGINIVEYWFARCNIDRENYFKLQDEIIQDILVEETFRSMDDHEKLRVLVTNGFIFGLAYGRGKEDSEF